MVPLMLLLSYLNLLLLRRDHSCWVLMLPIIMKGLLISLLSPLLSTMNAKTPYTQDPNRAGLISPDNCCEGRWAFSRGSDPDCNFCWTRGPTYLDQKPEPDYYYPCYEVWLPGSCYYKARQCCSVHTLYQQNFRKAIVSKKEAVVVSKKGIQRCNQKLLSWRPNIFCGLSEQLKYFFYVKLKISQAVIGPSHS